MGIKKLKITTLADNFVQVSGFHGQWGLSFLLEFMDTRGKERRIIFDAGNDKAPLFFNIKKMNLDLRELDGIVISHGHGDHTAAITELVEEASGVKVYSHPYAFYPRFYEKKDGSRDESGPPEGERIEDIEAAGGELVFSKKAMEVVPGLWTTGEVPRTSVFEVVSPPSGGGRRLIVIDGEETADIILDDQAVWMELENFGPLVISGCAHSGPANTVNHVKTLGGFTDLFGFIGGTHLHGRSENYLVKTVQEFQAFKFRLLSPCHCTGFKATAELWNTFPEAFVLNYCGRVIDFGKKITPRII